MTPTQGATPDRGRRKRGSLSPEEILRTTVAIIERDGLDGLSMPALAKELGAGVTSIYWYFRTKDELLTTVADEVTREVAGQLPLIGDGPWDQELVAYFSAFRTLMQTRPMFREVMVYHPAVFRSSVLSATMSLLEARLDAMVRAGVATQEAIEALSLCLDYTRGFISVEHSRDADPLDVDGGRPSPALADYPRLTPTQKIDAIYDLDDEAFQAGMALVVEGIRSRLGAAAARNERARPVRLPATTPHRDPTRPTPSALAPKGRRARGSLSQEEILDAAEQLIETNGLRSLSMPILAKHIGAGVTSIYWYFRSKEDLLIALAERGTARLYQHMPVHPGDGPWEEALLEFYTAYRSELLHSPVYLELATIRPRFVFSQPSISPLVSGTIDRQVAALVAAGLSPVQAARAYQTCSTYTQSYAMLEHESRRHGTNGDEASTQEFRGILDSLGSSQFPLYSQVVEIQGILDKGNRQFAAGISTLIAGIEAQIAAGRPARTRRPAKRS